MNDPTRHDLGMVGHGDPETLRELIAEQLWFAGCNCQIGILHAEIADDAGLGYAVRRAAASLRVVIATLSELREQFPQPDGCAAKQCRGEPLP